jgi:hypothetical protein
LFEVGLVARTVAEQVEDLLVGVGDRDTEHDRVLAAFILGMVCRNRVLRHREKAGHWDNEGHGMPEHPEPGVQFRPLEVPPKEPFD